MKIKLALACIAATVIVVFISCNWFSSKSKTEFDILGKWNIDSIENKSSDSSKDIGNFVLALASKDSLPLGIQFNVDSTFNYVNADDSTKGSYYFSVDKNSLFVKEDSTFEQLNFVTKTDSVISLMSTDSLLYHLRRR